MYRHGVIGFTLLVTILSAAAAAAQGTPQLHLPWDLPAAQAGAQLETAGFRRAAADPGRYVQATAGGFRRVPGDGTESTYTRNAERASESVYLRAAAGTTVQLFYSAVGDSATLQKRLDALAADAAGRLGLAQADGGQRVWRTGEGGRLSVPARPSRIHDGTFQFMVLYLATRSGQGSR